MHPTIHQLSRRLLLVSALSGSAVIGHTATRTVCSSGCTYVTIQSAVAAANTSLDRGGGIYSIAPLTVTDCVVMGNFADSSSFGQGGGIYHTDSALILRTNFLDNLADVAGGAIASSGPLTLVDAWVQGNQVNAGSQAKGGGLFVESGCPAPDTVRVRNSIIAGNLDPTPLILFTAPDCAGPITGDGYVHIGTTGLNSIDPACLITGSTSGLDIGGDPGLGPLTDNGGPTWTHALLAGSLNLDAGDAAGCVDEFGFLLTHDQRGAQRPDHCDRGAFETGGDLPMFRDDFEAGGPWRWSSASP